MCVPAGFQKPDVPETFYRSPAFFKDDPVAGFGITLFEDDGKDSLARHDAVPCLPADCTVRMAFLADLGDLAQRRADAEFRADWKFIQDKPLAENVLGKYAGKEPNADFFLQSIHTLLPEQTDLAMPVSRVGVPVDSVLRTEMDRSNRMLLFALLFTDTDGFDHCGLIAHHQHPQ